MDNMEQFFTELNKKAKYINYYQSGTEFTSTLNELIETFNLRTAKLSESFNLYFSFFAFEIPRYTVEETDTT